MQLKNGRVIDSYVKDSDGPRGFVFWIEDCFQPRTYFVRGESWEDANDYFVSDERVERDLRVDSDPATAADYTISVLGIPVAWSESVHFNDNGTPIDDEAVHGVDLATFAMEGAR